MRNKNIWIYIMLFVGALVILSFLILGIINYVSNPSGNSANSTLNAPANSNSANTSALNQNPETPDIYIIGKRMFIQERLGQNQCLAVPADDTKASCDTYKEINSILGKVNKENELPDNFRKTCLNILKAEKNKEILDKNCNPIIEVTKTQIANRIETSNVLIDSSDSDLSKAKEMEDLKNRNANLETNINGLNNSIFWLRLPLFLSLLLMMLLIGYQIWNYSKLNKLNESLEEISEMIGYVGNNQSRAKSVLGKLDEVHARLIKESSHIINSLNGEQKPLDEVDLPASDAGQNTAQDDESQENGDKTHQKLELESELESESGFHLLEGSVADIHIRCSGKQNLTKYPPYADALKSLTSDSETVSYYGVSVEENGTKHYAVPFTTRIASDSEARTLLDFYSIDQSSSTSGLNGKLIIVKPAQTKWDAEINGWRLYDKGVIKIES